MQQKLFQTFVPQEAEAFGSNMEKEPQKLHPTWNKYLYYIFTDNICSGSNSV